MPLMKVDVEKRTVHGFATLDNLDKQADIVTKAASVKAFNKFRGNIREQHDPHKAVGRVVKFTTDAYLDPETGKIYEGVFVSAYVSKGAEDTWQKVLDGTLSGFSIGGAITNAEKAYDEDMQKSIRIVHEYDLTELSLVDAPANQLANVLSIEKSADGTMTLNTPLVKSDIENIFWCKEDGLVSLKSDESHSCSVCNSEMTNIGFVESNDASKSTTVKTLIDEFKKSTMIDQSIVEPIVKEASKVAEDTIAEEAVTEEVAKSDEVVEESAPEVEANVEKADETSDEAEVEEVAKSDEAPVAEVVEKTAADKVDELSNILVSSLTALTDTVKTLNDRIDEIAKSVSGVQSEVAEVKGNFDEFGKRVDAVEDHTAFRKSGDLGEVVQEKEVVQKSASLWGGRFLSTTDL